MPALAVVGAAHSVGQAGSSVIPQYEGPQDSLPAEVTLFGNGQQSGQQRGRRVEVGLRGHVGVVEVQDMGLLAVDQSREFGGQPVRPPPDLGLAIAANRAAIVHENPGGRVVNAAETDAETVDDGSAGLVDRLFGEGFIGGFGEDSGKPVGHRLVPLLRFGSFLGTGGQRYPGNAGDHDGRPGQGRLTEIPAIEAFLFSLNPFLVLGHRYHLS